ncbi:hypothetical protein KEJ52_04095 [Candidatus Bathyarchaeota archaeon]|nr:hypothetical protein [Candidatus Bathyarchaeota archaeon]
MERILKVAVDPKFKGEVEKVLKQHNLEGCCLGAFTREQRRILVRKGREEQFPETAEDPYERILSAAL